MQHKIWRHNTNTSCSPTDNRANGIRSKYKNKFSRLDETFAYDYPGIVSNQESEDPLAFDRAQDRFFTNGVIPLVAGSNGQLNEDFRKSIVTWAGRAAANARLEDPSHQWAIRTRKEEPS